MGFGKVQVAVTIAAAGDYAAGDVLSNDADNGEGTAWVFPGVVDAGTQRGRITKAVATFSVDALVFRSRLHLFNANPSGSELDDNSAKSIAAADREEYIGYIDFPALIDIGAISMALADYLDLEFECANGQTTIWGILETLDAFTNESAGMTGQITLFTEKALTY